jgi:hypothetical protein
MSKWHKGPPPSIGWWPANSHKYEEVLCWWNGEFWSMPAAEQFLLTDVLVAAKTRNPYQSSIEWTDRPKWWPQRSKT